MKIISHKNHGYLDYVTVLIFFLAPLLLDLTGAAALLSYVLAGVHLLMTLATNFALGMVKIVPLNFHGWVEHIVGPVLIVISFTPLISGGYANIFYLVMGIIILAVGFLSDYGAVGGT